MLCVVPLKGPEQDGAPDTHAVIPNVSHLPCFPFLVALFWDPRLTKHLPSGPCLRDRFLGNLNQDPRCGPQPQLGQVGAQQGHQRGVTLKLRGCLVEGWEEATDSGWMRRSLPKMILDQQTRKSTLKGAEADPGVQHLAVYKALPATLVIWWSQQPNGISQEGTFSPSRDEDRGTQRAPGGCAGTKVKATSQQSVLSQGILGEGKAKSCNVRQTGSYSWLCSWQAM